VIANRTKIVIIYMNLLPMCHIALVTVQDMQMMYSQL